LSAASNLMVLRLNLICRRHARKSRSPRDDMHVGAQPEPAATDPVVAIYPVALPQVYGYLLPRCGSAARAEDLTAETFLAAVAAVRQSNAAQVSVAWLIGIARNKLVDHWRKVAREQRSLAAVEASSVGVEDPWPDWLDSQAAHAALAQLSVSQRIALTLRYLDGLPVVEVAEHLGRTVHATETLLVRSRIALRRVYDGETRP